MKKGVIMIVSVLIVLAVVAVLVFITINKKKDSVSDVNQQPAVVDQQKVAVDQKVTMENNIQQVDGVKITVLKQGTGAVVKAGDMASMNYTGTLADGTIFDSNVNPKFNHVQPFDFKLGAGEVIKGWDLGVAGMKVGEKRKLVLSPNFAYGATGAGGVIPPNATLTFEVELLGIKK